MDQHSTASSRLDHVIRSRTLTSNGQGGGPYNNLSTDGLPRPPAQSSIVAQTGYNTIANSNTSQNPRVQALIRKRQSAERAAIQHKIKDNLYRQLMETKKEKENKEKTRLWEDVLLPNWSEHCNSAKVKELCIKGIPTNLRGKVWPKLIGNDLKVSYNSENLKLFYYYYYYYYLSVD
jgi:hypothetical protein